MAGRTIVNIGKTVLGGVIKNPVKAARLSAIPAKAQSTAIKTGGVLTSSPRVPDAIGPKPAKPTKPNARRTGKTLGTKAAMMALTGPNMVNFSTKVLGAEHKITREHRHNAVKAREMYKEITAPLGNRPKKPST